jgi:hypothetical protein
MTETPTYKTRYRLADSFWQYDYCIAGGPAIHYDVSVIDNMTGDEIMTLSGMGCQDTVVEKFEEWLLGKTGRNKAKSDL